MTRIRSFKQKIENVKKIIFLNSFVPLLKTAFKYNKYILYGYILDKNIGLI